MHHGSAQLVVVESLAQAAAAAGQEIAAILTAAARSRGRASLACSGGTTPEPMFRILAALPVPWELVDVFQVDERVAPAGSPDRNATQLHRTLLAPTGLAGPRFHPMAVEDDDLASAVRRYAGELRDVCDGVVDVIHLGLGDDGHTASLVPDDPALEVLTTDVALTQNYRGHVRMTLTFPILQRANHVVWLLAGASKADVLPLLLAEDPAIPAGRVRNASMTVFADRAAAASIKP